MSQALVTDLLGTIGLHELSPPFFTEAGDCCRERACARASGLAAAADRTRTRLTVMSDYCDLCDLPKSQCVHGRPPPPPPAAAPRAATPRKAAPRSTTARSPASAAAPTRRTARKWTPPDVLRPHILATLQAADGRLDADELFVALEGRLDDVLLDGDRQLTPEGELRWRYAARRARQALLTEGLMERGEPGTWQLSTAGLEESTGL